MKLVDLTCSKCNATLQVNPDLQRCICQYCGNEMLIDHEIRKHQVEFSNGFDFGYQQEMGRQQALLDIQRQQAMIREQEAYQQEEYEKNRKIAEKNKKTEDAIFATSFFCMIPFFSMLMIIQIVCAIVNIHLFRHRETYPFSYGKFIFTSIFIFLDFKFAFWFLSL